VNIKSGVIVVNLFKKIMFLCLFLIVFLLIGRNSTSTRNQLPDAKPKNFNFVFNYGVNAKNQLDTIKEEYTKDMVIDPSVTTNFILSDEEMNIIYSEMKKINILNYPENFNPKSNMHRTPFETYSIKIVIDGKEKNIYWKDENISETKEAIQLRKLFKQIEEIIINKEEYKKLPAANGGYD
jgi:hypothetical protein